MCSGGEGFEPSRRQTTPNGFRDRGNIERTTPGLAHRPGLRRASPAAVLRVRSESVLSTPLPPATLPGLAAGAAGAKDASCLQAANLCGRWALAAKSAHGYSRSGTSARAVATVDGLLALYAEDATFESQLVPAILPDAGSGVLSGHEEIHRFLAEGTRRRPNDLVRWYRTGDYLCDGHTLFWEYPRASRGGADRHRRGHGDQRRPDPEPPDLLGMVWHRRARPLGHGEGHDVDLLDLNRVNAAGFPEAQQ